MNHDDHVNLLRMGVPAAGGVWADFGAGRGAFTLALRELAGPSADISAIDQDRNALRTNEAANVERFPPGAAQGISHYVVADFTRPLELPTLDGIVVANALHFHRHPEPIVARFRSYLRPGGRLIVVEYNIDRGNGAVPHPISFPRWVELAKLAGFRHTELLVRRPSRFLQEIYSAVNW